MAYREGKTNGVLTWYFYSGGYLGGAFMAFSSFDITDIHMLSVLEDGR